MKKSVVLMVAFFFLVGCTSALKDYKPKSSDEQAIKITLVDFESLWNKYDVLGVLNLIHENAQLMTGGDRTIVSKKQYAVILPGRIREFSPAKFHEPIINVTGDKAFVRLRADMGKYQNQFTFYMVRENNKWFIMRTEY